MTILCLLYYSMHMYFICDIDVIIAFEEQQYSFNESDVSSFISIVLNRVIARNATVEVIGGTCVCDV